MLRTVKDIDPRPYRIHKVLNDGQYHLSRDGRSDGRVYGEEDLQTVSGYQEPRNKVRNPLAKLSTGASLEKADKDHTTVGSEDAVVKRNIQDSFERFSTVAGPSTKPIKQEASEFDHGIAHEKSELHGSKSPIGEIKMEDVDEEQAENIQLATGKAEGLSDTSVSLPRLDYGQVRDSPSAEDDQLATRKAKRLDDTGTSVSELDDSTGASFSEFDDDDVLKEVRATNDQPVTGNAKELDTGASFSGLDDDDVLEEVSAQDDQLVQQQSREEAKTQNLRSVLSRFGLGERPLVDGKKRVRWRCGCGRKCYDDFTELRSGAAAELEKWLNDSMRKHTGSSASNSQQSATLTSAVSPNAGSSGNQQTAESDISLQSLGPSANVLPASNMNASISIDVNSEKCWLILCGNMKRGPDVLLAQMNLSSTPSDKSLFDDMKSVYSNFRQTWTLRSFLRGVKTIRFVQVGASIQD